MTKQEEVFYILQDVRLGNLSEYEAALKLQELDVVIRVNRALPLCEQFRRKICPLLEADYVAVEKLIEEEDHPN